MNYGTFGKAYSSAESYVATDSRPSLLFDIKDEQNFKEIVQRFPIVVVDAWAKWCNPCKLIMPKYNDLAYDFEKEFHDEKVIFLKDHIDDEWSIHRNDVSVVPSFFIYIRGQRFMVPSFTELRSSIQSALVELENQIKVIHTPY
jgi:thiol-disulfide isomerase/thioredoxin